MNFRMKISNKEKLLLCPKIVLKGWWWKKYFKHYRDLSDVTNKLYQHEWLNGGYECFEEMYKMYLDKMYLQYFPPIYVNKTNK